MLLADSAQVADGKLYILGGGWSVTGPEPDALGRRDQGEASTGTSSTRATTGSSSSRTPTDSRSRFDTPDGPQTIEVRGDFSAIAPDGVPVGTPVDVPIAVNFGPIPLQDGARFTWRMVIDGETLPGGARLVHDATGATGRVEE